MTPVQTGLSSHSRSSLTGLAIFQHQSGVPHWDSLLSCRPRSRTKMRMLDRGQARWVGPVHRSKTRYPRLKGCCSRNRRRRDKQICKTDRLPISLSARDSPFFVRTWKSGCNCWQLARREFRKISNMQLYCYQP